VAQVTIRSKLALGLFAIAVVLLLPLGLALRSLERLHATTAQLRRSEFAASLLLNRLRSETDQLRRAEISMLFVHDSASRAAMDTQVERVAAMADSLRAFSLGHASNRIRTVIDDVARYAPLEFRAAAQSQATVADSISSRHLVPAIAEAERVLNAAERDLRERTTMRVDAATEETANARNAAAIGFAVAGTLALIIAVWLWRSISRPVRDLEAGMAAVADGNFSYRLSVSPKRRDEFGRLAGSYQSMAQQLAQLDRLKAEFISIASHELKTPINVILGYLQLIEEGAYGHISPRLSETLRTLDAQAHALSRLVHQLLDISRFEAGGGKLDLRLTNLDQFLNELEETFRVLSVQRSIDFRIERAGVLPSEVLWDPDRINEVLGNLLSNAFKFTNSGGTVELLVEGGENQVYLTVRDTGAGIPPRQLPYIFKKFYQADNQDSAMHAGTGLGLAIAREIVVAHGGSISVESTVGVGTTFFITLPIRAGTRLRGRSRLPSVGAPA
jgi:signal transduction histidine kinase